MLRFKLFKFGVAMDNELKNIDTVLPIVSYIHQSGDFVSEISIIKISDTDDLNINKVEFYVKHQFIL